MEPLSTAEILKATRGAPIGSLPDSINGISTDTRTLCPGELFVALSGDRFDGHRFLAEAAERGASMAIVERDLGGRAPLPLIRVSDSIQTLHELGAVHRRRLKAKVVAITGSNGKTTTKDLTATALSAHYKVVSSPMSYNNFIGVPLTLFLADQETEVVVLELGTNSRGEIPVLAELARPDVAVVTNVAPAHLEGLGDLAGVLEEKGALLEHVREGGVTILNADDDVGIDVLKNKARGRVVTVGVRRRADYVATMPLADLDRIAFHLNGTDRVRVPMMGCHNLYNSLMALAVAIELGVPVDVAAASLRKFVGPPMRLTRHRRGSLLVIDDAYNANPGSMKAAFKTFAALEVPGRKVLVLGDMLELGSLSEGLHREVGTSLSCGEFDLVVAIGSQGEFVLDGARQHGLGEEKMLRYRSAEECARELPERLERDDAVLVKGSRALGLEAVVSAILDRAGASRLDATGETMQNNG